MEVVLVDDEPLARRRLKALLREIDAQLAVVGEAGDGFEALRICQQTQPALVLLDIRMPLLDGIAVARELSRLPVPPAVVFTTAYDDFALTAFELGAVDYLLKPVSAARLRAMLGRVRRFSKATWDRLSAALPDTDRVRSRLCVYRHGNLELIEIQDVIYFRAEQKCTTVRTASGEAVIDEALKTLEHEFAAQFVRIHRNALVALDRVAGIEKSGQERFAIRLRDVPERLEISRRHLAEVKTKMKARASSIA